MLCCISCISTHSLVQEREKVGNSGQAGRWVCNTRAEALGQVGFGLQVRELMSGGIS